MNLAGLILLSLGMGLVAWLAFYWSVKSGQYDDPEGPKYRMLEEEDERPPAAPSPASSPDPPADPGASSTSDPKR
jgi:cbb3-type cytochrome oxidase maturation protein